MGACKYSKVWKNCATCRFWDGERKADDAHENVTVDSSAIGRCQGFWQGSRKYSNDKCPEWQMWEELQVPAEE